MAKYWLHDPYVSINGVDLSGAVREPGLTLTQKEVEATLGGDDALRRMASHKDAELTLKFGQDHAASDVDATLFAAYNGGTGIAVAIRPTQEAKSATNPEYGFTGIVFDYQPFGESVGDEAVASTTIKLSDGSVVTRSTS